MFSCQMDHWDESERVRTIRMVVDFTIGLIEGIKIVNSLSLGETLGHKISLVTINIETPICIQ